MNRGAAKPLPENQDAEKSVLSSVFRNPNSLFTATGVLSEKDFVSQRNRIIFGAMIDLSQQRGTRIDFISVADYLRQKGLLKDAGDVEYISELEDYVPTSAAIAHHSQLVKEKSTLRELVKAGQELYENAWNGTADPKELIASIQKQVFDLSLSSEGGNGTKHVLSPKEWAQESFNNATEWLEDPRTVRGIATGMNRLDMILRGLKDVNIISASTGVGKTALGLNWAVNIAIRQNIPCLYLNYEMNREELELRIQSILSEIPINNIFCGQYNEKYPFAKIGKTSELISGGKLFLTGNQPKNINTSIALIHKYAAQEKIKVVFVDYLGEIEPDAFAEKENSEYRTFGRWVGMLKNVCTSLGVKLVLLAQLNREGEDNPRLASVGGSWKIAQKADVFLIIKNDKKDGYGIYIAKNRNGIEKKTVDIHFDKDTQRIYEI